MQYKKLLASSLILVSLSAYAVDNNYDLVESALNNNLTKAKNSSQLSTQLESITCYHGQKCNNKYTQIFYQQNPDKHLWLNMNGVNPDGLILLQMLRNSYFNGIDPQRFKINVLELMLSEVQNYQKNNIAIPMNVASAYEVSMTDAYLSYLDALENGVVNPNKIYSYWHVEKNPINYYSQFISAVNANRLVQNLQNIETNNHSEEYRQLKNQLAIYINAYQSGAWSLISFTKPLKLGMSSENIKLIKQRLSKTKQYNLDNDNNLIYFNHDLQNSIKLVQKDNNLEVTGIIDKKTLELLNQSPLTIIKKIAINMDRMRWLPEQVSSRRLWINIPSYELLIYENNKIVYQMPVIVGGGKENKTCSTMSKVTNIELNPYWGVPNRIATKEYLKKIQESSGYLARHDMKIYKNGSNSEVDPSSVDWSNVNEKNFNYNIRQQPGNKNALGQYKFRFDNGCGIYLHDTSNKNLFARDNRSMSHGCIRVAQPKYLAEYLTNTNTNGYTFNKVSQLVNDKTHKFVSLSSPIAVYIVYYTAYVDASGELKFQKDIYDLDSVNFPLNIPHEKDTVESANDE